MPEMPVLMLRTESNVDRWVNSLTAALPGVEIRLASEAVDQHRVHYAVVWNPPVDIFVGMKNLRAIFSVGAGVDHLSNDLHLPAGVPVIRMVDDELTSGMVEYVLYQVLKFHREFYRYEQFQHQCEWRVLSQTPAEQRRIGILGLGVLGQAVASQLSSMGFDVSGWSRTGKDIPAVNSFAGIDALEPFLKQTDILVCLLPLTDETRGIIDASTLGKLPRGAYVINAARGEHVVESDLLVALDQGHIKAAALDVFEEEPLPADNPLWVHPAVFITPHAAAQTGPESAALRIAEGIARVEAGAPPRNAVDMSRGY